MLAQAVGQRLRVAGGARPPRSITTARSLLSVGESRMARLEIARLATTGAEGITMPLRRPSPAPSRGIACGGTTT